MGIEGRKCNFGKLRLKLRNFIIESGMVSWKKIWNEFGKIGEIRQFVLKIENYENGRRKIVILLNYWEKWIFVLKKEKLRRTALVKIEVEKNWNRVDF